MGLAEKVRDELPLTAYAARECMHSGRKRLEHAGKVYCLLSDPWSGEYCPLQAVKEDAGYLAECMRAEYLRELSCTRGAVKKG